MSEELGEAPYLVVWTKGNVDNKAVRLYYLGKGGWDKLRDAVSSSALQGLKNEVDRVTIEMKILFGDKAIIDRYKELILQKLTRSKHFAEITYSALFWTQQRIALEELLKEGKVVLSHGWYKRKESE